MSERVFNQARARKVGGGFLVFAEFELYNDSGVNIAPLGTASATSDGFGGLPALAIDGSADNTMTSTFHSLDDGEQIWTLTMDRPYSQSELSSVGILARNVGSHHDSAAIELLSTDGQPALLLGTTDTSSYQTFAVPAVVVNWVLDANSMYEVSSKKHLIQIMNDGAIYENAGDVPTPQNGQWGRGNWIQTADIDLEGKSTNIRSLGYTSNWAGIYDGNGYTISNWAFVESSFPSASTDNAFGLFGVINGGTVKNVRLAGVCTLSGFKDGGGMISTRVLGACVISNIEVDLSPGSYITQSNSETTDVHMAPVFGRLDHGGTVTGVTFKGTIDSMTPSTNASANVNVGGIVGYMRFCTGTNTLFRNLGAFPSGLSGARVGGIAGYIHIQSNLNKVLNAMTGDISGTYAGGVYGLMSSPGACYEFINSMKGNITANGTNSYVGGIGGTVSGSGMHSLMNYMTGDIINTNNAGRAGGLLGQGASATDIATSINAMNGTVYESIMATPATSLTVATVNTSFGLEFTSSNHSTTDPVTGLSTDPETGLPVFDLTATDPDGVTYTFDIVFGNLPPAYNQLQIKATEFLNMSELEIYNLAGGNIALLGTASTDASQGASQASRGIDGNTAHDFASGTVMDLYLAGGPTWTLDLDRAYTLSEINKVVFYNRSGTVEPARAIGSVVTFYSADGDSEQVGVLTGELIQDFTITPVMPFPTTEPGLVPSGVVMYVNAGDVASWVDGASAMNDLSGSSVVFDSKTNVTPPSLSEGGADFTPANNSLKLSDPISVQTISLWLKKVDFNGVTLIDLRELNNGVVGEPAQVENGAPTGTFFTGGTVYLNGAVSTYAAVSSSPDNEFINVTFVGAHLSAATRLTLFANFGRQYTYPTIFRGAVFYDRALTADEILENYNTLALRPRAGLALIVPLTLTPRPLSVAVVVGPQDGATGYRITSQETGSSTERIVKNGFTNLEQTIRNLSPETEYTFRLYSTSGQGYSLVDESTVTTLQNSASNYDKTAFGDGDGNFSLADLSQASVDALVEVMNDIFATGEEIELAIPGGKKVKTKFVKRGGNATVEEGASISVPFSKNAGAGQSASLTLSDSTIVSVSFDETTEAVTVEGTAYNSGESFVLDGKKVTIVDI